MFITTSLPDYTGWITNLILLPIPLVSFTTIGQKGSTNNYKGSCSRTALTPYLSSPALSLSIVWFRVHLPGSPDLDNIPNRRALRFPLLSIKRRSVSLLFMVQSAHAICTTSSPPYFHLTKTVVLCLGRLIIPTIV